MELCEGECRRGSSVSWSDHDTESGGQGTTTVSVVSPLVAVVREPDQRPDYEGLTRCLGPGSGKAVTLGEGGRRGYPVTESWCRNQGTLTRWTGCEEVGVLLHRLVGAQTFRV